MKSGGRWSGLREAEALAERLNDDRRRGRVCAFMANSLTTLGELDEALVSGSARAGDRRALGDLRLRILTTTYLEQAHYFRGEYERAVELATRTSRPCPPTGSTSISGLHAGYRVYGPLWLVMSLAELGRFAEAAEYAGRGDPARRGDRSMRSPSV